MKPLSRFFLTLLALAGAMAASACGSEEEPEAEAPSAGAGAATPRLEEIPREQLYGASPVENLWTPRYEVEVVGLPAGWDGVRLAVLSDFHLGYWDDNQPVAAAAVQRALDSGAEIIALLGDYVDTAEDLPALRQVLAPLQGRGALAVLGDRDVRSDSLAASVVAALQESGVTVLRNSAAALEVRGDSGWIAGLDADVLERGFAEQQYIAAILGVPGRTPVLLTHLPALVTRAPDGRFPVIIGGNTFCGDVEVPLAPRLSWLAQDVLPGGRVEGIERVFRVQGSTLLVTCGLGYGFVPVRFGAPPEVPIVTLRRAGGGPLPPDSLRTASSAVADSLVRSYQGEQPDSQ